MTRHLRHKFAIEIFRGRNRPIDIDCFPKDEYVNAWRALYLLDGVDLDEWYIAHFKKHSDIWRKIGDKPFHIISQKMKEGVSEQK